MSGCHCSGLWDCVCRRKSEPVGDVVTELAKCAMHAARCVAALPVDEEAERMAAQLMASRPRNSVPRRRLERRQ